MSARHAAAPRQRRPERGIARTTKTGRIFAAVAVLSVLASAQAQQPIFYPAKGQSANKQHADEGQCAAWAKQTTGIDPIAVAQAPVPQGPSGPAVGGGQRVAGAARGAVAGEVLGEHPGEGAALGAMAGGVRARRQQAAQREQVQQQGQQAKASQISTYNRAVGACMQGRGYSVK
jgi:hypothetical protein